MQLMQHAATFKLAGTLKKSAEIMKSALLLWASS